MLKDCVAVLSIGSSSVNILIGERGVNGTFIFRANVSEPYYAFMNGEFTDIKELEGVIAKLLTSISKSTEITEISKIYVGIPGEFTKTVTKNFKITFNDVKKISYKELKALYDIAFEDSDCEYTLVHRSEIYYTVDDVRVDNPIGKKGNSLAGRLSFSLVSNNFKDVLRSILKKCKISNVKFISEDYAMSQYLFKDSEKNACKILVDVGSITTSISISVGNGLLFSGAIPMGGGLISAHLFEKFNCDYDVAESLKRKINLGLRPNPISKYAITDSKGEEVFFSRDQANEVARAVLDGISEEFDKVFSSCTLKIPSDSDTYFTGGGICYVKGAVEYVSTRIGVMPKIIKPSLPRFGKPDYSARLALLNTALNASSNKIFFV